MTSPAGSTPSASHQRRLGGSGLAVPPISLGLWQNFGEQTALETQRGLVLHAVDAGIVHIDLANNYGPPPGAAEASFGRILARDLAGHRDELLISTKAGYRMWPGAYGEGGSRKHLLSSLDQSLDRLGLDHVDIFYSHRYDPTTPLEETIGALATAVSSGRARYVGVSSYSARRTREALAAADTAGVRLSVHQPSYSLLNRWIEEPDASGESVLDVAGDAGLGVLAFSPLAQGMLTTKYLDGIPGDSRAARGGSLPPSYLSLRNRAAIAALAEIASDRGQSLAQMAVSWCLRDSRVSGVLVGARTTDQLDENLAALEHLDFSAAELAAIDENSVDGEINLWAARSSAL
ncbi:L-glyceraldehyde 3-phosphate reductase [Sanguibacter gelidistatuariae]|uniref:L-glyceraldehyde 3-phosphate reductase n=1 Tax=Sanguibacter gelidistatuariae TaxID=1814289 RepID=A0A1G6NUQ3_9MICO|nr:aldo/keto reductase [Sanguibacter gelidistatuariae]SDC71683.1 L-glyceraldehyde 3-phosphate reductase [Sanguibacter gelidistatuariae]